MLLHSWLSPQTSALKVEDISNRSLLSCPFCRAPCRISVSVYGVRAWCSTCRAHDGQPSEDAAAVQMQRNRDGARSEDAGVIDTRASRHIRHWHRAASPGGKFHSQLPNAHMHTINKAPRPAFSASSSPPPPLHPLDFMRAVW